MIAPMLAKLATKTPPEHYVCEPKYDGLRAISYQGILINRSFVDVTDRFPEVDSSLTCTLDGELVCFDAHGEPDFQAIQKRMNRRYDIDRYADLYPATFVAFDILLVGKASCMDLPLAERRELLASVPRLYIAPQMALEDALGLGWEGAMAKDPSSKYMPGVRSSAWLKVKPRKTVVMSVIGPTPGTGKRADTFGALLCAAPDMQLSYVGTGYTDEELHALYALLRAHRVDAPGPADVQFVIAPDSVRIVVSYLERTDSGAFRFPAYQSLVD